jgi:UDP-glucose 4-epimerase
MILAVTGATGFLGRAVLRASAERGIEVRALVRRGSPAVEGVEVVDGDLGDRAALDTLVDGAGALIHLAALMGSRDEKALESVNVQGTRNVLEAAERGGVGRFVHVSSVAAGRPGHGAYSRSKARGEEVVQAGAIPWVIVRPPVMIGPGSQVESALRGLGRLPLVPVITGGAPLRPVQVDDAAHACLEAALSADAAGTWTLAGEDMSFMTLSRRILTKTGSRARPVPLPGALALVIAAVAERVLPAPPLTVEGVRAVLAGSPPAGRS